MQTNPHVQAQMSDAGIDKLQECLRLERSAMETYELALGHVSHVGMHSVLQQILASHAVRADRISARLTTLGAEVPEGSGAWGALAKALQAGADLLGDRAALTTLKEGEDHALGLYVEDLASTDPALRQIVDTELLPEQRRTRELCWSLKDYATAPS